MYPSLPNPFFVLAPMDDVTDTVFRQIVAGCAAPDLFFTEFVNVDGLQSIGRAKLLKRLQWSAHEKPLVVQLWGKNPENFEKTAAQLVDGTFAAELGLGKDQQFAGVDLNMGCPDKTVVKNGTCSALINDRPLAHEIIEATRRGLAGALPLSVKTRLGFTTVDMSWPIFLLRHNIDMLTIHGRTRSQMSKVPANWELIGTVRKLRDEIAPKTLIVGNGDVTSYQHGKDLVDTYKLDGVMVGRGVFQDPFIFSKTSAWKEVTSYERIALYKKHIQLFAKTWQHSERPTQTLNKFCKIYISGFDGAKELREVLMQAKNVEALLSIVEASSNTSSSTMKL
jgi:tRNA-dihydrouridine synthase